MWLKKSILVLSLLCAGAALPIGLSLFTDLARKPTVENSQPSTSPLQSVSSSPPTLTTPTPTPAPYWKKETHQIETKAVALAPGQTWAHPLWVNPEWRNARLVGRFTAQGGGRNDIEALVTDRDGMINWRNNQYHRPKVWYQSGRVTADTINAPLPTGHSFFAFDNRFSTFAHKSVNFDLKLEYERLVYP